MIIRWLIAVILLIAPVAVQAADSVTQDARENFEVPQELIDLAQENEHVLIDYYREIEPAAGPETPPPGDHPEFVRETGQNPAQPLDAQAQ